jgi:hypothetical protein
LIDYGLKNQLKDIVPILFLNILLGGVFYFLQITWVNKLPDLLNLIAIAFGFFAIYLLVAFIMKMEVIKDLRAYLKK